LADDDLDVVVRVADPDRWLGTRFIADPSARADVLALYAFDHQLARAPLVASNPLIAEIRLTWWREALEEIHSGGSVRSHPVALALTGAVRRHGLAPEALESLIDARIGVLGKPLLDRSEALTWAEGVAGAAAGLAARVLDPGAPIAAAVAAGRVWGLALLSRRSPAQADGLADLMAAELPAAARAAQRLSPAAFPAIAHVTLARSTRAGGSMLGKQLRLLWAVASGRL
jgi:phytoene synthase